MSLKCPFCQSAEIVVIEMNQQSSTALAQVVSPATLGALGATVAKSFNLPPLVGGVAGTVIGGLISAVTEQPTLPQQSLCYCQSCTQKFPSSLLHTG